MTKLAGPAAEKSLKIRHIPQGHASQFISINNALFHLICTQNNICLLGIYLVVQTETERDRHNNGGVCVHSTTKYGGFWQFELWLLQKLRRPFLTALLS